MSQRLLEFQEWEPKDWSGLTTVGHLGEIYQVEPQLATEMIHRIHQINFGDSLENYLRQFGVKYLESDDDFTWKLQASGDKNIPIVSYSASNMDKPGVGFTTFEVTFAEKYFHDQETIVGELNEKYPIRIMKEPVPNGTNWTYTVVLMTGDSQLFFPPEELAAGKRFSKEFAVVEPYFSTKGGGVSYTSPFSMRNSFSMIRIEDERPGNMIQRPVAFSWVGEDGKLKSTWMEYADYELERQFARAKNLLLNYSTSNKTDNGEYMIKGLSNVEIRQGAGIRQQMESGNVVFYDVDSFDVKWLTQLFIEISVGKTDMNDRQFLMRTGEFGMLQWHESLENYSKLWTPAMETNRVFTVGKDGKQARMAFRGQFMEYYGPNGIVLTVAHDPWKDDPTRNKIMHPKGGFAESYRYDVMDVGGRGGEANVQLVYQRNMENIMGYEAGLRDPFTMGQKNRLMSNSMDSYKMHRASICGVMIIDPTRTISIIPNLLR